MAHMPDLHELFEEFSAVSPGRELRQRIVTDAEKVLGGRSGGRALARPWRRRAVGWALAAAGVAVVLVLLAAAAHSRHEPNRLNGSPPAAQIVIVDPTRVDGYTGIEGGSARLRTALKASLAGVGHTRIRSVTVSRAPHTYRPYNPHGIALTFDYPHHRHNSQYNPDQGYAQWQTGLVAAAARDRILGRGSETVIYFENGLDEHLIGVHRQVPQRNEAVSSRQLVTRAQHAANEAGIRMTRITILHPRGLAVAVSLTPKNPPNFLRHRLNAFIENAFPKPASPWGAPPTPIDGYYVELRSGKKILAAQAANYRTQESEIWGIRPIFGCFPGIAIDLAHPNSPLFTNPMADGVPKCPAN
jgi:hypothetical protein